MSNCQTCRGLGAIETVRVYGAREQKQYSLCPSCRDTVAYSRFVQARFGTLGPLAIPAEATLEIGKSARQDCVIEGGGETTPKRTGHLKMIMARADYLGQERED